LLEFGWIPKYNLAGDRFYNIKKQWFIAYFKENIAFIEKNAL
jgi:hypothetical protein